MYENILKESGSHLNVLVVDEICEYRNTLDKKLSKYFHTFTFASSPQEALSVYKKEQFNIVIIDIDKESIDGVNLIGKIQEIDPCQTIFVYSEYTDNSSLLMHLLNLGVSCFIDKSQKLEDYYKIFSIICKQKCERKMLMYYIDELEKNQNVPPVNNSVIEEDAFEFFPIPSAQEDDFDFFPTPSAQTTSNADNSSVYKDYYSFLDSDDREDMHDLLLDIDTTLLDAFTDTGGTPEYIAQLGSLIMRYGNILMNYQFFSDMGMAILELGKVTSEECEKVAAEANNFHSLIGGFCSGLQVFMVEVWETESDNPKYFNDSIVNDAKLIMELIVPPKVADNEDDLVFF